MTVEPRNGYTARRFSLFPKPLGRVMETVTKPAFRQHGLAEVRMITEWRQIIGATLADRVLPTRLSFQKGNRSDGTLHLLVASGWALEVQHLEPIILDKIATYFGYRAVGRLSIRQGPLPTPPEPQPARPQAAPLPAEAEARLNATLAPVSDADLKEALAALGRAILQSDTSK